MIAPFCLPFAYHGQFTLTAAFAFKAFGKVPHSLPENTPRNTRPISHSHEPNQDNRNIADIAHRSRRNVSFVS
jgi:hypothetical protein